MSDARANIPTEELDRERTVKATDLEGALGTTGRYWINCHLPALARAYLPSPLRVLDLGCGDGPNARLLAGAGFAGTYLGVDLAPSALWPERTGHLGGLDVRFRACDAHAIGDIDGAFDALVSVSAFEHFEDDRRVVAGLAKRLVPGARGIVIVPSPYGNLVWGFQHGYRKYTPDRFRATLQGSPFRLIEAVPSGALPSLVVMGAWRAATLATTYAVLGALFVRHGTDRAETKRRHPWIPQLASTIQFAHLRSSTGRRLHQRLNQTLAALDDRVAVAPTQWAFVIERT
jgi:SAM-dependent methyltransferase